jgi:uncharacterized protein YprB with RNaseH-like and TPR domain
MIVTSFDLETTNLNADFGMVLCGCSKTWTEPGVKPRATKVFRLDESPEYKKYPHDDKAVVIAIRDELEKSDIIVGWNSKRFDVPFLNGRLVYWNEYPMEKIKHIDLMYQAMYKLKLHSARLASVQAFLGLKDEKSEMKPQIWMRAITGDKKAMDYIVDHCRKDVAVLDEAYTKLRHFVQVIHP